MSAVVLNTRFPEAKRIRRQASMSDEVLSAALLALASALRDDPRTFLPLTDTGCTFSELYHLAAAGLVESRRNGTLFTVSPSGWKLISDVSPEVRQRASIGPRLAAKFDLASRCRDLWEAFLSPFGVAAAVAQDVPRPAVRDVLAVVIDHYLSLVRVAGGVFGPAPDNVAGRLDETVLAFDEARRFGDLTVAELVDVREAHLAAAAAAARRALVCLELLEELSTSARKRRGVETVAALPADVLERVLG